MRTQLKLVAQCLAHLCSAMYHLARALNNIINNAFAQHQHNKHHR